MDYIDKEKTYSEIEWVQQNSLNPDRTQIKQRLFNIFEKLLEHDGYKMSNSQARLNQHFGDDELVFFIRFDFTAINNKNYEDWLGVIYMHNAKVIDGSSIRGYLHNANIQKCPRQIIVTNTIIDNNIRGQVLKHVSTKIELIDLLFLKNWLSKIDTSIDKIEEVNIILKAVNDRIAKLIAENPKKLLELEWRDTERLVADVLSEFGFLVELTPSSKDGGKDIILECINEDSKKSYIIEIKHWRSGQRVGSSLVRDFINVIVNEKRDKGLYISTFGYTDNVFESLTEIDRHLVRFGDQNKIVGLCKMYTKKRTGIWIPEFDKEQLLFEGTV